MVGSAEPINGFLCLKTTKMYVLSSETVGSTEPTDGFLDPAMQETLVLLHETEGSEDPINGMFMSAPLSKATATAGAQANSQRRTIKATHVPQTVNNLCLYRICCF